MENTSKLKGDIFIDYSGNSGGLSFKYKECEDGQVEVTKEERVRFTRQKPMMFDGTIEGEHDTQLDNWSQDIKDGKVFYQVDMFGHTREVPLNELKEFLNKYYQGPKVCQTYLKSIDPLF